MFGLRAAPAEQVGEVVALRVLHVGHADVDQAEARRTDFAAQQLTAGGEGAGGELGRAAQALRARANFKEPSVIARIHRGSWFAVVRGQSLELVVQAKADDIVGEMRVDSRRTSQ